MNDVELTSKFSNIYIMLLYALMNNDIKRVAHYLSDDMFEKYNMIIQT